MSSAPHQKNAGFSLLELLIVVAIILIITAIVIPNLIRARATASESSAVQSLRTIVTAENLYSSTYGNGFSPNLLTLSGGSPGTCNAANLVDSVLASGLKSNYKIVYAGANALGAAAPGCTAPGFGSFQMTADPNATMFLGQFHYFVDQSGVIRQNSTGTASSTDPPIT